MNKFLIFIAVVIIVTLNQIAFAQISLLKKDIEQLCANKDATIGVALYDFSDTDTLSINGNRRFPMQSVFKFHTALALLNEVDKGRLKMNDKILISRDELLLDTWSPIRDKHPEGNVELTLSDILVYTVSMSDNNGCDLILNILGGAANVNSYIHGKGISDVNIEKNEQEMQASWNAQFSVSPQPATSCKVTVR